VRATEIGLATTQREELLDITERLRALAAEQGWREGLLHVFAPHTTAAVCLNENANPAVARDLLAALRRAVPKDAEYGTDAGNADAHAKSALVGASVVLPIVGGKLQIGRWQGVFFAEFDGPRSRSLRLYFLEG
jgi:secondary thiamine-phosphate synthase enzyme